MESGRDNRSSDLRTGPATNLGELHQTSPVTEQGHGSTINSHLEAQSSALGNNPAPPPSLSSSPNPFLLPSDATDNTHVGATMSEKVHDQGPLEPELHQPFSAMQQGKGGTNNGSLSTYPAGSLGETHHASTGEMLGLHSSLAPSAYESSPGNPFHEPTNINSKGPVGAFESWQNKPSAYETGPANFESHHTFSANAASKSQKDTNAPPPKLGLDSQIAAESSDDDIPISSMPKHGQSSDDDIPISSMPKHGQSSDVAAQYSAAVVPGSNWEFGTNNGSEIQNPPVQVMERPGDSGTTSSYNFPSHVFARNNTNAPVEWSTASNESLFSIYMGNMSFSSDLTCFGKPSELDKPGDIYMSDPPNAVPSNQPPNPVNKFNDISQRTAELHEEGSKVTEAKAAETMREVIMETSRTTENIGKGDLSFAQTHSNKTSKSHHHPRQSDGSTKSFAFHPLTDGDKSVPSKGAEEKQKQQKQLEKQETPNAAQAPQSTTNASPNRWLSCFPCCTFCR